MYGKYNREIPSVNGNKSSKVLISLLMKRTFKKCHKQENCLFHTKDCINFFLKFEVGAFGLEGVVLMNVNLENNKLKFITDSPSLKRSHRMRSSESLGNAWSRPSPSTDAVDDALEWFQCLSERLRILLLFDGLKAFYLTPYSLEQLHLLGCNLFINP